MKIRILASVVLVAAIGGILTPEKGQAFQPEDGGDAAPKNCDYSIVAEANKSGKWFFGVPMTRHANQVISSHMLFDATNIPVSSDKKWIWVDASGYFDCSRINLPFGFYIDSNTAFELFGAVVPAPPGESEEEGGPPPSGTGGGGSYEWNPEGSSTITCLITDWFLNGVYTDTVIESPRVFRRHDYLSTSSARSEFVRA